MWDLGNRGVVLLISVTCGCVLVYNAWGTILALAFLLLLVIYVCYSLLANDCLISPQAYHVLGYLREGVVELGATLRTIAGHGGRYLRRFWHCTSSLRESLSFRMDRRRVNSYQLSSDSCAATASAVSIGRRRRTTSPSSSSLSKFSLIEQLSPIPRVRHPRSRINETHMTDERFYHTYHTDDQHHSRQQQQQQQLVYGKHTSTPVFDRDVREEDPRNGSNDLVSQSREASSKKNSPIYAQNHTLSRGENATRFSPEGSPWGMSISPKMRPRPAGVKTVQTTAGPLLASTRYNIDPKVYTDVTSPGLTTRLTKYATEAKSKLNHQSQYGTGQFPKVNLNASPVPMLTTKLTKLRMPVTVRVAPPDAIKYSPPERQKILFNICHTENKSPTSVVQVLRDISLKRHASREDISFDMAKKQRTEDCFNEEREMVLEEIKQKRPRDDLSKSEEDLSPQSKSIRPAKRTKTRSCYDILNSLSSSIHVASGVKRKAVDFSRSGTPDFEKHFKSLESAQASNNPSIMPQSQDMDIECSKPDFKEIYSRIPEKLSNKSEEFPLMKGILKSYNRDLRANLNKPTPVTAHKTASITTVADDKASTASTKSVKLTDKLFMRAEPKRNEQLKVLMEEPGDIKIKFTSDNVEEIRREDIRHMRQTSMKARLQSMFDAISGKAESRFNPDVVIQAEDVNTTTQSASPVTCSSTCATLNSSTTTTNINTTPLSTAAIVPSGFSSSKFDTKSVAAFSLPNATLSAKLNKPATSTSEIKDANLPTKIVEPNESKIVTTATTVANTESSQKITSTPSTISMFTFAKPISKESIVTSSSSLPGFSTSTLNSNTSVTTTLTSTSTSFLTAVPEKSQNKTSSSLAFVPINSSISEVKIETNNSITNAIVNSTTANIKTSSLFSFASGKSLPVSTPVQTLTSNLLSQTTTEALLPVQTTNAISIAGFNASGTSNSSTSSSNITTTTTATSLFTFASNATALQPLKSNMFTFGQSSNKNIQATSNEAIPLSQAATKSFSFTSSIPTSINTNSSFNANAITTTTTTATIPTFGLPTTSALGTSITSTTSSSKSLFVFGASNISSVASTPITTVDNIATGLGTISNTAIAVFGAPATTVSQFGTPTTSIFATTSNTTSSTNIFSASQPIFGTASGTPSIFNPSKTTEASIFASTTSSTTSASLDGATAGSSLPSLFSNANSTTSTTSTSSIFSRTTPIFGQAKPAYSGTTMCGMLLGNDTNKMTPLFGSTTQTTGAPTFGSMSTSTISHSNFDVTNNTAAPAFGTNVGTTTNAAPAFGSTAGIFGSTDNTASVPIFGANATPSTAGAAFGVSSGTNAFGTPQSSTSLTFGTASSGTAFGDGKSPFDTTPATTTGFGSPSSTITAFGTSTTTNNTNNNASNMFVFGNNQKDGQQNTFSFGSNFNTGNNNSTATSSTPFQFGSTSAKPAETGFNFTASTSPTINFGASSTTPTFNPSTPGMFNIGSGSTAPRSRTIRTRKPR